MPNFFKVISSTDESTTEECSCASFNPESWSNAIFASGFVTALTASDNNISSVCNLGFTKVKSHDLCKNLKGCTEAFVFAVTLGLDAERHLLTLSKTSSSRHFICDAYYSALAEAVCDKAEEIIKKSLCCKARFSPGYGDLPLEMQRDVLNVLDSVKNAGITLTDSLLMTPQKSITAILGITQNLL